MFARLLANAVALAVATWLVPGISLQGGSTTQRVTSILVVAVIFGLLNALVKPVVKFVSLPFIWLTLGLGLLVINTLFLLLTSAIARSVGQPWHVAGFGSALVGSVIISLVSGAVSGVLQGDER